MCSLSCARRIINHFLLSTSVFSLHCLATDDSDESSEEKKKHQDNGFFRFSTRKPFAWEDWTVPTREPPHTYDDGGYSGSGDPTIFFIILAVGVIIFFILLILCKRARDEMTNPSGPGSVPGTSSQPSGALTGGVDVTISVVDSSNRDPPLGRPGIVRQLSEKPPDYATVTLGDLRSARSPFPSILRQMSSETPPPKYDENNPMFK